MQERDAHINLRKRKQAMDKHIDNQWEELHHEQLDEYDEKLRIKLEAEYKKKMDNAQVINDQLHNFKMSCVKKMQEEILEGELIKRQVEVDIEHEKQKELERKRAAQEQT